MPDAKVAVAQLLKTLNTSLKPYGFRRSGQSFNKQTANCWQVIGVQLSRWSEDDSKSLTVNIGITSKKVEAFHGRSLEAAPTYSACPIYFRIHQLTETKDDLWWQIREEHDAQQAASEIMALIESKVLPELHRLETDGGILHYYATGHVMGFEIQRDETRLILLGHHGTDREVSERFHDYAARWLTSGAAGRARGFIDAFRAKFPDKLVLRDPL